MLQTIFTINNYRALLTPRKCFAMSEFSTLNDYICPQASSSDTCLWRARWRCPRQHLQEGYTYLQLLWPPRKSCPAWMCALHSPGHAIYGLPQHWGAVGRRLGHEGRGLRQQLSALLPCLLADFLSSHWRTKQKSLAHGLCPCLLPSSTLPQGAPSLRERSHMCHSLESPGARTDVQELTWAGGDYWCPLQGIKQQDLISADFRRHSLWAQPKSRHVWGPQQQPFMAPDLQSLGMRVAPGTAWGDGEDATGA